MGGEFKSENQAHFELRAVLRRGSVHVCTSGFIKGRAQVKLTGFKNAFAHLI